MGGAVIENIIGNDTSTISSYKVVLEMSSNSNNKIELAGNPELQYWCIGRQASTCHVRITHKSISRQHAILYFNSLKNQLYLHDLGGKHGSYVNQKRISSSDRHPLQDKDVLSFGNCTQPTFLLHLTNTATTTTTKEESPSLEVVGDGLTGRAKREAEIAAAMASLDQTPTYNKPTTTTTTTQSTNTIVVSSSLLLPPKKKKKKIPNYIPIQNMVWLESSVIQDDLKSSANTKSSSTVLISTVAWDKSGTRCILGSSDAILRFYDVSQKLSCFQQVRVCPSDCHTPILDIQFNCSGSHALVCTTSSQPLVLDRDGHTIHEFAKGDVYIQYSSNSTIGHTASVNSVDWHPTSKDICVTCSLDGTCKTWNITKGKTQFQKLCNTNTYLTGTKQRTSLVQTKYTSTQQIIAVSQTTLFIWNVSTHHRPTHTIPILNKNSTSSMIQSISLHLDASHIAIRTSQEVQIWTLSKSVMKKPTLYKTYKDLPCPHEKCNVVFGPTRDTKQIIAYSSTNTTLRFADITSQSSQPLFDIPMEEKKKVIFILWHSQLNQILCTFSDGTVCIYYSNDTSNSNSNNNIITTYQKFGHTKQQKDELEELYYSRAKQSAPTLQTTKILNPLVQQQERRKKQQLLELENEKMNLPHPPATGIAQGDGNSANLNFTQHIVSSKLPKVLSKDPRTDLFQYTPSESKKRKFGLDTSQPTILATKTVEQEQEELQRQLDEGR